LKTELAVGSISKDTESWQLPPPWTAEPESSIVFFSPTFIWFILETLKPFWDLQGNWALVIGLLSILSTLYGTGDFMMTWALAVARMAAAATMVDRKNMMVEVVVIS
jgi:hypothetical protein